MKLEILRAGFLTSVQDDGRNDHLDLGVSCGGAMDRHALRVANTLAGNDEGVAGLEFTLGRASLKFADSRMVAWCGGGFEVRIGSEGVSSGTAAVIRSGEILSVHAPAGGGRAWLAVSGGIDVPLVLGSRSTDLRGNFGGHEGRALKDGDVLALGKQSSSLEQFMTRPSARFMAGACAMGFHRDATSSPACDQRSGLGTISHRLRSRCFSPRNLTSKPNPTAWARV